MAKRMAFLVMLVAAVCLLCGQARAQATPLTAEETSVDMVLQGMVRRAGVIFTGSVAEVRRVPATDGGAGVVEVEFAVDRGLRGVRQSRYVLREWAGMWAGTDERYRVGQRLLMLLYAPSASGLSSPVGGMDGAIPIRPGGVAAAEPVVDLRWVAARVSRGAVRYRAETPRVPRARAMAEETHAPGSVTVVEGQPTAVPGGASVAAECASVSSVVAAIAGWGEDGR